MSFKLIPVAITQIVNALERESANTDTDPRWLSAAEMRRMANWENRTLMCFIDEDPKVIVMGSGNAMTEPARYLPMNRSELIALCEALQADNEDLRHDIERAQQTIAGLLNPPSLAVMDDFAAETVSLGGLNFVDQEAHDRLQLEQGIRSGFVKETACDHRWSAPTPPGCSCSKCGLVVPTPVNKSHPNPSGEPK